MSAVVLLPGAGGERSFWVPVAGLIERPATLIGWPGFAGTPSEPAIRSLYDLPGYLRQHLDQPTHIVAQSMGGVVALMFALQYPDLVRSLVLTGTSGGLNMSRYAAEDWRLDYAKDMPEPTPSWFPDDRTDLSSRLAEIHAPTLLIWGEHDSISPIAIGRELERLLPNARMTIVEGGSHAFPCEQPQRTAELIRGFLTSIDGST